jgi:hypothetical protein
MGTFVKGEIVIRSVATVRDATMQPVIDTIVDLLTKSAS